MASMALSKQVEGFVLWLALTFAAAAVGAYASIHAAEFYTQLALPMWAPSPAVFGPVWSVLYVLMGLAAWLVWRVGGFAAARTALSLFLIQLALNALWSCLFFGAHRGMLAFLDIVLLWFLIAATLAAFWRVRAVAGLLLVPYLLWVSFAGALNFAVWQFNPQALG